MRDIRGWLRRQALALLALLALLTGCAEPALVGTDLGATPAPAFALTDQTGAPVALAGLRGKAVALTFLYTACPDTCPATAAKLRLVHEALGADAARVALVVVSVDPERDTLERLRAYSEAVQMTGRWHFLTGSRSELGPVWAAYGIGVLPGPGGSIGHTDAVYVIDRQGRRRVLLRADFQPADLAANLRALLRG